MKLKYFLFLILSTLSLPFAPNVSGQWIKTNCPKEIDFPVIAVNGTDIFAGSNIGVFLSTDGGIEWSAANNVLMRGDAISSFTTIGTDMFIGTWGPGNGVSLSTDSGMSWTPASAIMDNSGGLQSNINAVLAIGSYLFAGTDLGGVFLSTDSGTSWTPANNGLSASNFGLNVDKLFFSGSSIFAAAYSSGVGGIFRSMDSGGSWILASNGLPADLAVQAFAVLGANLFIGTLHSGVFRLSDNGSTWTAANTGLLDTNISALGVSGENLFAGTQSNGVFLSTNNGASWTEVSTGIPTNTPIKSFAVSGSTLFAGAYASGIWMRPLSEMITPSAVETMPTVQQQITAYPNPFSQSSTITFSCAEGGVVEVTIVNLLGAEVARLFSGELGAGEHSFSWDASGAPAGMYECVVRVGGSVQRIALVCGPK